MNTRRAQAGVGTRTYLSHVNDSGYHTLANNNSKARGYLERQATSALGFLNVTNPDVLLVATIVIEFYPYVVVPPGGRRFTYAASAAETEALSRLRHLSVQAAKGRIIRGIDSAKSALDKARQQSG